MEEPFYDANHHPLSLFVLYIRSSIFLLARSTCLLCMPVGQGHTGVAWGRGKRLAGHPVPCGFPPRGFTPEPGLVPCPELYRPWMWWGDWITLGKPERNKRCSGKIPFFNLKGRKSWPMWRHEWILRAWFRLNEAPIVKIIKTDNRTVVARGWAWEGKGSRYLMDTVSASQDVFNSTPLKCILNHG